MIFDRIENIDSYKGISEGMDKAFAFLKAVAIDMEVGAILELGDGLTARCLAYETKSVHDGIAEAHKRYIDVMLMREGYEQIGYMPVNELTNFTQDYDPETDASLAKEERMTMLPFDQGSFAVFFPQDAHMPGIECDGPRPVTRIVIKVPV